MWQPDCKCIRLQQELAPLAAATNLTVTQHATARAKLSLIIELPLLCLLRL
jgi:hypothetical protein